MGQAREAGTVEPLARAGTRPDGLTHRRIKMDLSPVGQLELMVAQVVGVQVVVGLVTALGLYCWRAIRP